MLPRMPPTASWYSLKLVSRSPSLRLVSASVVPEMRRFSLPFCRAFSNSRKVFVSLPSRKAISGLISSPTNNELAFFAIRCVNITIWLAAAISRTPAPDCSLSAATCSESSSISGFLFVMEATSLLSATRLVSISSNWTASLSVALQVLVSACSWGCTSSGDGGTVVPASSPPLVRRSRLVTNWLCESRNCLNADVFPCNARLEALARRCESIRISPAVAM